MRKAEARNTLMEIVTSKRIAVALCAAVAMVLGAMSVGATYRSNSPTASSPDSLGGQLSALEDATSTKSSSGSSNPKPLSKDLTEQSTLHPSMIILSQPKIPLLSGSITASAPQVQLNLGTINASVTPQTINLNTDVAGAGSVDVSVPVPDPTPIIDTVDKTADQTAPVVNDTLNSTLSTLDTQSQN